ncbi:phage protein [Staphylococcus gallinarum]|nr:phage protein [Staphylococcus gallinarum]
MSATTKVILNDQKKSNDVQQPKRNDTVNHPSHYNYGDIEVIDFIEQVTQHYNANVAYHIGNAIKYLARSPYKNGKEDIAKAKWYIERAFENWDVK